MTVATVTFVVSAVVVLLAFDPYHRDDRGRSSLSTAGLLLVALSAAGLACAVAVLLGRPS